MDISEKIPYDQIYLLPGYQKALAVLLLPILIIGGVYIFVINDKNNKIKGLHTKINTIENDLKKNRLRKKKLPELKEKIEKLNFRLLIARTQLPSSKEVPDLLEQVSNLGKRSGLEFLLFKPQAEQPKDFYNEVPVQMKVSGTFHNITNFFDKIGNFNRIINISNINMKVDRGKGKNTILHTSCNATTFMYTGGKDAAKEKKKNFLNNKLNFSLKHSTDWLVNDTGETDLTVKFSSPRTKKGDKATIIVKLIDRDDITIDKAGMSQLVEMDKKDSKIFKNDFTIISEIELTIGNFPAHQIDYSYTKKSEKLIEKVTYIIKKGYKIFTITSSAKADNFNAYEPLFEDAIQSFWIHSKDDLRIIAEEKLWSDPESTYSSVGKRDPFKSLLIAEKPKVILRKTEIFDDDEVIISPLQMFDSLSLNLVGVILGQGENKMALIETTDGKGYIIKRGDPIGKKRGTVKEITNNTVIIEEKRKFRIGSDIKIEKELVSLAMKEAKES